MPESFAVALDELQPSQLFLSDEKLAAVLKRVDFDDPGYKPVEVAEIKDKLAIIDGHHRAFVAHLAGADDLRVVRASDEVDLAPYRECVGWCEDAGIYRVADLAGRLVGSDAFEEVWIRRCHGSFGDG